MPPAASRWCSRMPRPPGFLPSTYWPLVCPRDHFFFFFARLFRAGSGFPAFLWALLGVPAGQVGRVAFLSPAAWGARLPGAQGCSFPRRQVGCVSEPRRTVSPWRASAPGSRGCVTAPGLRSGTAAECPSRSRSVSAARGLCQPPTVLCGRGFLWRALRCERAVHTGRPPRSTQPVPAASLTQCYLSN